MSPKHAKGVRPDGAKIRALRLKAQKSQKSLVGNSTVQLRTLQRAEEGKAILPAILQQIAELLEVPLTDLTLANPSAAETGNVYRLYNARNTGGRKLHSALHDWGVTYHYGFSLDPDGKLADLIAAAVRHFQAFEIVSFDDIGDDPAWKIRMIGGINDRLAELEANGVWVYFGKYREWTTKKEDVRFEPDLTGGGSVSPSNVSVSHHVKLRFSDINSEFITDQFFEFYTRDQAELRAFRENFERGIDPDWLVGNPLFNDGFVSSYREAYKAMQSRRIGHQAVS